MSTNEDSLKVLGCFAAFAFIPMLAVFSALLHGWALITLWRWFIVESFQVAPLSYLQAVGIILVVRLVAPSASAKKGEKDEDIAKMIGTATLNVILTPVIAVAFGWLILLFMKA